MWAAREIDFEVLQSHHLPTRLKGFTVDEKNFRFFLGVNPWGNFFGLPNLENYTAFYLDFGITLQPCLPLNLSDYQYVNQDPAFVTDITNLEVV